MPRVTVITSLYNSLKYLNGYFEAVGAIQNKDEIEILLIHNAPSDEELAVVQKNLVLYPFIKYTIVPREGLYATWNRGIKMAQGRYITNWNVDDIRLPDSLANQADSLDLHHEAMLSYGDFIIVDEYGKKEGRLTNEPVYQMKKSSFMRNHHIGCFPMWRRSVHESIGYFDEQFKLVADLDFQIRIAKQYPLIKIEKRLGYYLEGTPSNLSSNYPLQRREHTMVQLRYGNFSMLHLFEVAAGLTNIKLFEYKWFGEYHKMKPWKLKDYFSYLIKFPLISVSVIRFPRQIARKLLNG